MTLFFIFLQFLDASLSFLIMFSFVSLILFQIVCLGRNK